MGMTEEIAKFLLCLGVVCLLFGLVTLFVFNLIVFGLLGEIFLCVVGFALISFSGYLLSKRGY
jgi:uncharacterized membrane-anchored protein